MTSGGEPHPARPYLRDILLDDNDDTPCNPPDDCVVCVLLVEPEPGESFAQFGSRLLRDMLLAEYRQSERAAAS